MTIERNLALMQLTLADIPAPFDINRDEQRIHAYRCLTAVQGLIHQTLMLMRGGAQFRSIGRPKVLRVSLPG
jgi:hypothetical protein